MLTWSQHKDLERRLNLKRYNKREIVFPLLCVFKRDGYGVLKSFAATSAIPVFRRLKIPNILEWLVRAFPWAVFSKALPLSSRALLQSSKIIVPIIAICFKRHEASLTCTRIWRYLFWFLKLKKSSSYRREKTWLSQEFTIAPDFVTFYVF